ncbi:BTB/POZ domain-containing protein 6-like isoform X2 [Copidosoma floridanum]|uniref:BTB/POZ domain-containing protein 6-like isoform X2 n=1 Tax=Copidosoma floridanum TaxID=29053 RepID=UPI000C6F88E2|nr:BTB/POZ domain-containing protein 6-like isoform X2 [Copidosoma floridanum]
MVVPYDWQTTKRHVAQRCQYLLEMGQWSDCRFKVGQEPNQQIVDGHKVFLAMSSPVFEAMFYGGMAEKNDPIPIRDVQPEAFKALLEYIYTDKVNLGSFELACELCYCAKKYMLPFLVKECTEYLWSDLSPKKACRAYEFAKLFEEPVLMDKCLHIMRTRTKEVINESSWDDVEQATVLTLLDQDALDINSEIDLFNAVEKWAKAECTRKSLDLSEAKSLRSVIGNALTKIRYLTLSPQEFAEGPGKSPLLTQQEAFALLMNVSSRNSEIPMPEGFSTNTQRRFSLLVMKVLNPDFSKRAQPKTMFGKLPYDIEERPINLVTSSSLIPYLIAGEHPSSSQEADTLRRQIEENSISSQERPLAVAINEYRDSQKYYCIRTVEQQSEVYNDNILDCTVTFVVDKSICVLGIQVPSQILNMAHDTQPPKSSYTEILYAHLLDSFGTRLTYTHFSTKVEVQELIEVTFNRPIMVQKNKLYKIGVVFNRDGWYPLANCSQSIICDSVLFRFGTGNSNDTNRDGLIRSIVFTYL